MTDKDDLEEMKEMVDIIENQIKDVLSPLESIFETEILKLICILEMKDKTIIELETQIMLQKQLRDLEEISTEFYKKELRNLGMGYYFHNEYPNNTSYLLN